MRKRTLLETTWNLIDFTEPNRWLCSMSDDDDGADLGCLRHLSRPDRATAVVQLGAHLGRSC